ncbi:glycosyltransferase [Haloarcula salinisoli]|uniref:Glycosyltransferase n=1 Tax=Haloarcula salinisoli TaxID=2487746 RepID=A0A8J7YG95_9EURY|nr:glycosyltransferase [Halomicroarcula salinisoli]MBX0288211.1 glycosyltransferase [Halomicroarcula salinisoli]MBX0305375.1 glycosyltransferase [Halomicroarcula salinisoli]
MTDPSVGVVVPAYRPDVAQLRGYLERIDEELGPASILVELDSPREETVAALADTVARVESVQRRRGKGAAITTGFERLETDVLAFADADGATPVDSFEDVLDPVLRRDAELAVGSRRHPESEISDQQTLLRQLLGDTFSWLAGTLLSARLHDYQCGAKAVDAESWHDIRGHLCEPGFAWDVELVAIAGAMDLCIEEVPIEWEDQPGSTVSPVQDSLDLFRALLAARKRSKALRDDRFNSTGAVRDNQETPLIKQQ